MKAQEIIRDLFLQISFQSCSKKDRTKIEKKESKKALILLIVLMVLFFLVLYVLENIEPLISFILRNV